MDAVKAVTLDALFEHAQWEGTEDSVGLQRLLIGVVLCVADHQLHPSGRVIALPDRRVQFDVQSFCEGHWDTGVAITHC